MSTRGIGEEGCTCACESDTQVQSGHESDDGPSAPGVITQEKDKLVMCMAYQFTDAALEGGVRASQHLLELRQVQSGGPRAVLFSTHHHHTEREIQGEILHDMRRTQHKNRAAQIADQATRACGLSCMRLPSSDSAWTHQLVLLLVPLVLGGVAKGRGRDHVGLTRRVPHDGHVIQGHG